MEIKSIFDAEFSPYGQVHKGYKLDGLLAAMKAIPLPESGTTYQPTIPELEALPIFELFGVRAFRVPAGVLVEVYATTLHYAPCHTDEAEGFRVAVALPRGTNEAKPAIKAITEEDQLLWARNKWLLAHEDSAEAGQGAAVRLSGDNNDIANDI
ncbi:MAG: DUF4867 family protein [Oscillospiraceae bacterium]|nr:DUF4867 family protein [Oscillospiraceae bacterium]